MIYATDKDTVNMVFLICATVVLVVFLVCLTYALTHGGGARIEFKDDAEKEAKE